MIINVSRIKKDSGARQPFHFEYPSLLSVGSNYSNIRINGEVLNTGMMLEVTGNVCALAEYACSRCLEHYTTQVDISFKERFQEGMQEEDSDNEFSTYYGDEINIADLVRESIILAEPFKLICREECQGLCPVCGKNLNTSRCSCASDSINPKFAVLQKIFEKE